MKLPIFGVFEAPGFCLLKFDLGSTASPSSRVSHEDRAQHNAVVTQLIC